MHLDADDLIAQFGRDWPTELELSRLRLLVARQQQEIERLNKLVPQPADGYGRQFPDGPEVTRHDLQLS